MAAVRGRGSWHTSRRGEYLMGQKIVGQKDPITWTCGPLLGAWLVGAALIGLIALLNWPRH